MYAPSTRYSLVLVVGQMPGFLCLLAVCSSIVLHTNTLSDNGKSARLIDNTYQIGVLVMSGSGVKSHTRGYR